jgi:hypothetical protein
MSEKLVYEMIQSASVVGISGCEVFFDHKVVETVASLSKEVVTTCDRGVATQAKFYAKKVTVYKTEDWYGDEVIRSLNCVRACKKPGGLWITFATNPNERAIYWDCVHWAIAWNIPVLVWLPPAKEKCRAVVDFEKLSDNWYYYSAIRF